MAIGRPDDGVQEEWLRELTDQVRDIAASTARLQAGIERLTTDPQSLLRRSTSHASAGDLPTIGM